jgi:hypothetical protein
MRTVSFSNSHVRRLLNNDFVNTFTNTQGDPTAGMSISHRPTDAPGQCIRGNGKQNVQTIFMTPDGEIFHVATGFLSSEDLLAEARFAKELFGHLKSNQSDNRSLVVEAHRQRLLESDFSAQQIDNRNPMMAMMMFSPPNNPSFTFDTPEGLHSNFGGGQSVFEGFIRKQFLEDNQFPIRQPLMSWQNLQNDPAKLVGNGKSFFASSSSRQ